MSAGTPRRNRRAGVTRPSNNNYYEFGTGKSDPARNAGRFKPQPWTVEVAGHAEVTGRFTLEDLLKPHALEERIYRHRCVEAWSMVIPWVRHPARRMPRALQTHLARQVCRVSRRSTAPNRCQVWPIRCSTGPTAKPCASTRPCIRLSLLAVGLYGRDAAEPERRAAAPGRPVEIRFQGRQVHRAHRVLGAAAGDLVEPGRPVGIRFLFQREPRRRSSALDPVPASAASPAAAATCSRGASPPCPSTATVTKSLRCTPAWTFARITEGRAVGRVARMTYTRPPRPAEHVAFGLVREPLTSRYLLLIPEPLESRG